MTIKGGFAPIRVGLLEHMSGITPMETKVYFIQHMMAKRTGLDRGKVSSNLSELSRIAGHKRDHIRRAIQGLKEKGYIEPIKGGWRIVNFNGNEPIGVAQNGPCPLLGHGPKGASKWPEKGQGGGPKRARGVARKGPDRASKPLKTKPDTVLLDVKKTYKRDVEDKKGGTAGATPPLHEPKSIVEGKIIWARDTKDPDEPGDIFLDDTFKHSLHAHLYKLATTMCVKDAESKLSADEITLTPKDYRDVLRKLTDICLRDQRIRALESSKESKKRAFKTFCVHRFEEALSYKHQRLARFNPLQKTPLQQTLETIARMNKEDRESGKEIN